jgi:hypothetical protein
MPQALPDVVVQLLSSLKSPPEVPIQYRDPPPPLELPDDPPALDEELELELELELLPPVYVNPGRTTSVTPGCRFAICVPLLY